MKFLKEMWDFFVEVADGLEHYRRHRENGGWY
jgi:hypothetical protein